MEIRTQTGAVMYESEFRAHMKETTGASWDRTTDDILESFGATVVLEGAQATGGTVYQHSVRQGVEQVDGKWYTKYVLGPVFTDTPATDTTSAKTAAENEAEYRAIKDTEQAKSIRQSRDQKLKDSDWTQIADAPVNKEDWAAYRQALRNLPSADGFPWIDLPSEPA
jgi:hypothetical protein